MVDFHATTVVVDEHDPDFILVGFANEHDGSCRDSLMFQRSDRFDEQDITLGLNDVYIERKGQGQGAYGGIRRLELQRDRVLLQLDGRTADRLGATGFQIRISLVDAEYSRLRRGLQSIFGGFDNFVDRSA